MQAIKLEMVLNSNKIIFWSIKWILCFLLKKDSSAYSLFLGAQASIFILTIHTGISKFIIWVDITTYRRDINLEEKSC